MAEATSPVIPGYEPKEGDNCRDVVFNNDMKNVKPLPALVFDDEEKSVLTRWELTPEEIEQVIANGSVYLWQWTYGRPIPPLLMTFASPAATYPEEAAEQAEAPDVEPMPMEVERQLTCQHTDFAAQVTVNRIEDTGQFMAHVRLACAQCMLPFSFNGLPAGLRVDGAATSPDGLEAILSMSPGIGGLFVPKE